MSHTFKMAKLSGSFLADGNVGNKFRFCEVEPRLAKGESLVFDFMGVTNMTDSFSRACFETLATEHPDEVLANIFASRTARKPPRDSFPTRSPAVWQPRAESQPKSAHSTP